jgi:hypothetical protein
VHGAALPPQRVVHVGVGVRDGDVELLVRVHQQSAPQQLHRPAPAEVLVGGGEVGPGPEGPAVGETDAEHRVLARRLHCEAVALAGGDDPAAQSRTDAGKMVVHPRCGERIQCRHARGGADRIAVERVRRPHHLRLRAAARIEHGQHVGAPRDGRQGVAAADRLAVGRQVGHDAVALLRTAPCNTEARHDLVEDQHDAVARGGLAHRLQEAGFGQKDTLQRLDDHGGQLVRVALDQLERRLRVVERRDEHVVGQRRRHADRVGQRARVGRGLCRHGAEQAPVVHAVPRALELEHLGAAGARARDAQRIVGRLGARARVVHALRARDGIHQPSRQLDLGLVQEEVRAALVQPALDRRRHTRMPVSEQHRSGAEVVVDVLSPGDVNDPAASPVVDDQVQIGRQHEEARAAASQVARGVGEKLLLADRSVPGKRHGGGLLRLRPIIVPKPRPGARCAGRGRRPSGNAGAVLSGWSRRRLRRGRCRIHAPLPRAAQPRMPSPRDGDLVHEVVGRVRSR